MKIFPFSLSTLLKVIIKVALSVGLCLLLVLGSGDSAWAARSSGRIGGGSFRSPSSYRAPSSRSYSPSPTRSYGGGGVGFSPFFFLPFFGFGGGAGGLLGLMVLLAVGGFLVRSLQSIFNGEEGQNGGLSRSSNPSVSLAKLQVGLTSQAQALQTDLNRLTLVANTNSNAGLVKVLQETTLALLRHPQYWAYGNVTLQNDRLATAEAKFNRLMLAERSKLSGETLSNVAGTLLQNTFKPQAEPTVAEALQVVDSRSYIVVTILLAVQGKLSLGKIQSETDLKQALQLLGSVSADQLLSLEILWAPQADGDTLTADELLAQYPDLQLI